MKSNTQKRHVEQVQQNKDLIAILAFFMPHFVATNEIVATRILQFSLSPERVKCRYRTDASSFLIFSLCWN
jgi:hypothetical protein